MISTRERLILERTRRKANYEESARRFGVSKQTYSKWERGEIPIPDWVKPPESTLTLQDTMVVFRLKKGWSQRDVAIMMGTSFTMVRHLESGRDNPSPLVAFWKKIIEDDSNRA